MPKTKIYIVEDDKFFRELVTKKLIAENCEVSSATDGMEALAYLNSATEIPDLVILDLLLPKISGYEFLSLLKKEEKLKNIPVLVLSNLGQQEEISKAFSLGAVDFLVKVNFTLDEVISRINKILGK